MTNDINRMKILAGLTEGYNDDYEPKPEMTTADKLEKLLDRIFDFFSISAYDGQEKYLEEFKEDYMKILKDKDM